LPSENRKPTELLSFKLVVPTSLQSMLSFLLSQTLLASLKRMVNILGRNRPEIFALILLGSFQTNESASKFPKSSVFIAYRHFAKTFAIHESISNFHRVLHEYLSAQSSDTLSLSLLQASS